MKRIIKSDTVYILIFFLSVILIGTFLLSLPSAWAGTSEQPERLEVIDAFFTATSAVCVTGLITVNTSDFSRFGQIVIMLLIQIGGLGIISITSLRLMVPGQRLSIRRLRTIKSFYLSGVEHDPSKILRNIVLLTFFIELAGIAVLFLFFTKAGIPDSGFSAFFHSISAFCNAGFSLYNDSLEGFATSPGVLLTFTVLIITGGIGFIVLQDISLRLRRRKSKLSYHTKLILSCTVILIFFGAAAFWFLEKNNTLIGLRAVDSLINALFQSVTTRTAGFNSIPQSMISQPSKYLTMVLMFIGGAPGSTAGGIKISTAYLVFILAIKKANERGEINAFKRRISPETINSAVVYFIKAAALLLLAAGLLCLFEGSRQDEISRMVFEAISAFGTVGLSLGITSGLSTAGKLIIIATMYIGRVGLLAFLFVGGYTSSEKIVYREAEILVG